MDVEKIKKSLVSKTTTLTTWKSLSRRKESKMAINCDSFIHPKDRAALTALRKIPLLGTLLSLSMRFVDEMQLEGVFMASMIRLSERQFPRIYKLFMEVCESLELTEAERPQLFIEMNPIPNAYTIGNTKTFISIHSGMVDMCTDEELKAVIAHECGHIVCHHMLYHTLALKIAQRGVDYLSGSLTQAVIEKIAQLAVPALMYWSRCSEYSADRISAWCTNSPKSTSRLMVKLAGGPATDASYTRDAFDIDEYFKQLESLEKMLDENKYKNLLNFGASLYLDHPFTGFRVTELLKWWNDPLKPALPINNVH